MRESRVWKGALIALSAAAVLALLSYMALWSAYFDRLPRSPIRSRGGCMLTTSTVLLYTRPAKNGSGSTHWRMLRRF